MMQDRTCDEVRKVGDEKGVVNRIRFLRFTLIGIDKKGDLSEREERDSDRECDVCYVQHGPSQVVQSVDHEVEVLEIGQGSKIEADCQDEQRFGGSRATRTPCDEYSDRKDVVASDRPDEEREVSCVPVAVEE